MLMMAPGVPPAFFEQVTSVMADRTVLLLLARVLEAKKGSVLPEGARASFEDALAVALKVANDVRVSRDEFFAAVDEAEAVRYRSGSLVQRAVGRALVFFVSQASSLTDRPMAKANLIRRSMTVPCCRSQ